MSLYRWLPALSLIAGCLNAQMPSLALSSAKVHSGGTATLDLSLQSTGNAPAAGLQWTFRFSALGSISLEPGSAAASVGKTLICAGYPPVYTCLVVGPNAIAMADGVVARLRATLPPGSPAATIDVIDVLGASPAGDPVPILATGGAITVDDGRHITPGWGGLKTEGHAH